MVCSREASTVPQSIQLQEPPPGAGCGPKCGLRNIIDLVLPN